jgi:mannose-6-phosphate isomerase-like protein (cupin superfamily)
MSDYTILNLREVDDAAPGFGFDAVMESRFATRPLGGSIVGLALETIKPGQRIPFAHRHREQEEAYVVLRGSGRVKIEDEIHDVRQWDVVRVGPGTTRNFEAGEEGLELLAFGAPVSVGDDSEILPGWWSD